jgi:CRISPR-associated protein Csd1
VLLDKLVEYHRCQERSPFAYRKVPVPWVVHLNAEGKLIPPIERTTVPDTRPGRNPGRMILAPVLLVPRTSGARATLLVDRADYALGFAGREPGEEALADAQRNHALFLALLRACYRATEDSGVQAVISFFQSPENQPENYPLELEPRDLVGFTVADLPPQDAPAVQQFWADLQAESATGQSDASCLVCGMARPIARRHPSIKGVPGGQTSGMALVSANLPAFQSYGLQASLNAPVCVFCAEAYTKGINALLSDRAGAQLREGNTVYLFWDQQGNSSPFADLLRAPSAEQVEILLCSHWRGRESPRIPEDPTRFYAAAVSASGSRVVVRDWLETDLRTACRCLARYFVLQRLPGQEPFSLFRLRRSLALAASRRIANQSDFQPGNVITWLVRSALSGEPLPSALLYQAVRCNRAEQGVTSARAALIKMVLLSSQADNTLNEEGYMDHSIQEEPAYLCGRLLALVELTQATVVGYANTTLVGRFYSLASSSPARVFGLLLRNSQPYLSRLRRERAGTYIYLQRELGQILDQLPDFPSTLDLRKQGIFALGYYYQRQERFRRREPVETPVALREEPDNELP